jgi:protein-L-isoaspartate(D-aspartate) O-methyltransferase
MTTAALARADLATIRRFYAEEIAAVCGLRSAAMVDAFAAVPRERFLGPGPWRLCAADAGLRNFAYYDSPDDHPRHVYHNVPIALDESRTLNNGQPSTLAAWMQWVALAPGERIVHVGTGTGYFSAVMSVIVGPTGSIAAFEVDAGLAARARAALSPYENVTVIEGDASAVDGPVDVVFVNAGATHPHPAWLAALSDGGRLLLPLTVEMAPNAPGKGFMLKIVRKESELIPELGPMVAVYSCVGARDADLNRRLGQSFMQWKPGEIRSVRIDPHESCETCWIHGRGFCLSREAPAAQR